MYQSRYMKTSRKLPYIYYAWVKTDATDIANKLPIKQLNTTLLIIATKSIQHWMIFVIL